MKYNDKTVFDEFRHAYRYKNFDKLDNSDLVELLNRYYDNVKMMSIADIMPLLPMKSDGPNGTYFQPEWMIQKCEPNEHYPFTMKANIYDWHGDRSTTDVVNAVANDEQSLYQRLLILYLFYLLLDWRTHKVNYDNICDTAAKIINAITKFKNENETNPD